MPKQHKKVSKDTAEPTVPSTRSRSSRAAATPVIIPAEDAKPVKRGKKNDSEISEVNHSKNSHAKKRKKATSTAEEMMEAAGLDDVESGEPPKKKAKTSETHEARAIGGAGLELNHDNGRMKWIVFCLVIGTSTPFPVEAYPDETIGQLKKRIKNEKPNKFGHIDADELTLYQVDIPADKNLMETVKQHLNTTPAPEALNPVFKLSKYFTATLPEEMIHILVQPPSGKDLVTMTEAGEAQVLSAAALARAQALHTKAWGQPWPHSEEKEIRQTEIDDSANNPDDVDSPLADKLHVPATFKYRCLGGIHELKRALNTVGEDVDADTLVVRKEYIRLREALDHYPNRGMVVTGHPGIGMTTFLFYLLLYRLEKRLPTAVQLDKDRYFIFDERGAVVVPTTVYDVRLKKCWALADSNTTVYQPCEPFLNSAKRVISTASSKPERWKVWIKHLRGACIISDLPSVPEIAAIVKELGLSSSSTLSLVRKWGPSTRNIIRSIKYASQGLDDPIEMEVQSVVDLICESPSTIFNESVGPSLPRREGSSIIFLRRPSLTKLIEGQAFIPTPHLISIFEERRCKMHNQESLELFFALSLRALTKTAVGWAHEISMHKHLGTGGGPLSIFRGTTTENMQPSTRLLPGTLAGLKEIKGITESFYWMPSVANFPGVDGVVGNTNGRVYAIQAIIGKDYKPPKDGIKEVWGQLRTKVREKLEWNYVVVTETQEVADAYVKKFSNDLREFTLGTSRVRVQVWGCVLNR